MTKFAQKIHLQNPATATASKVDRLAATALETENFLKIFSKNFHTPQPNFSKTQKIFKNFKKSTPATKEVSSLRKTSESWGSLSGAPKIPQKTPKKPGQKIRTHSLVLGVKFRLRKIEIDRGSGATPIFGGGLYSRKNRQKSERRKVVRAPKTRPPYGARFFKKKSRKSRKKREIEPRFPQI